MIIDWIGYPEGAIRADTPNLIVRREAGNVWVETPEREVYNVHPETQGVFPIRWQLDEWELLKHLANFNGTTEEINA